MKSLVLSIADGKGGGAIGAMRMHKGLRSVGIDSHMHVQYKYGDDFTVTGPTSKFGKAWALARPTIDSLPLVPYKNRSHITFSPAILPDRLGSVVSRHNPDIVHLRWVCGGFMRIESLKSFKKPIVWTLSDSWAFTGGCHYQFDCDKYLDSCGACPALGSTKEYDLSRKVWTRKKNAWADLDMTIVSGSKWLADCAKESSLFKDKRVEIIPNGMDLDLYKAIDKKQARDILNLPQDKILVLFGAISGTSNKTKGFHLLVPALKKLKEGSLKDKLEFVVFGASKPKDPIDLGFKTHYMGHLDDEVTKVLLYSAVDTFVLPSLQENLPYTVMESIACGTPVVGFSIGGVPDMVDHKKEGYLAKPESVEDLQAGLQWVLEDSDRLASLSVAARERAVKDFSYKFQAERYLELYKDILK